jgi:hypothetical protein
MLTRICCRVGLVVPVLLFLVQCASPENTGGSGGTAGTGGIGGASGSGGSGGTVVRCPASDEAVAFCDGCETTCGFGGADRYANQADCESSYDSYNQDNRNCVEQHLGFAMSDANTHCPHAAGAAPCNEVCIFSDDAVAFCMQYETTCGFGGPDRYGSQPECESSYDSFSMDNQACVEQHVGFAMSDATTHCPHAMGQPPCNL